ncbi:flagellar brake protein [Halothiobacillus sp. DCM-1]|uniref:flagellar brake protein n=1 Tax=Halothiobacillus sp. DCM-1 TaxID=3112558 RepID=UPI00324D78B4
MQPTDDIITVQTPRVIDKIIARHFEQRGHFQLIPEGDESFQAPVSMVANDPERRRFLVDQPPELVRRHLSLAPRVRVQALIDQLVSWFYVETLREKIEGTDRYYELPYPAMLERLQRRSVFRVGIPPDITASIAFVQPTTSTVWLGRIDDLSAAGCAMALRPDQAIGLAEGVQLAPVKIRIEGMVDLSVQMIIRNQRIVAKGEWIFGAEFMNLSPLDAQQLDRAVMRLQRLMLG